MSVADNIQRSYPISDIIEESIRIVLSSGRERSLSLKVSINNGEVTTNLKAIDEEEIVESGVNVDVKDLVRRNRDCRRVRDACLAARQHYFEMKGRTEHEDNGCRQMLQGSTTTKKGFKKKRGRYRAKGKLARMGLPPDPWREHKIKALKLFTEIVNWI